MTVLEVLIAFFLPPVSVAMRKGLSSKVLIALLLQLCGHIPGVIYGIYVVTKDVGTPVPPSTTEAVCRRPAWRGGDRTALWVRWLRCDGV
jgi:uncharacterized membrane protein YqaE (UPF0057 family)